MEASRASRPWLLLAANHRPGSRAFSWLTVNKARKGDRLDAPIRSTKTGKPKRLSVPVDLQEWIERHVPAERRVGGGPLFTVPWSGRGICPQGRWSGTSLRRTGRGAEEMRGRN